MGAEAAAGSALTACMLGVFDARVPSFVPAFSMAAWGAEDVALMSGAVRELATNALRRPGKPWGNAAGGQVGPKSPPGRLSANRGATNLFPDQAVETAAVLCGQLHIPRLGAERTILHRVRRLLVQDKSNGGRTVRANRHVGTLDQETFAPLLEVGGQQEAHEAEHSLARAVAALAVRAVRAHILVSLSQGRQALTQRARKGARFRMSPRGEGGQSIDDGEDVLDPMREFPGDEFARLFGLLQVGDVDDRSRKASRPALFVRLTPAPCRNPPHRSVALNDPVLGLKSGSSLDRRLDLSSDTGPVIFVDSP